MFWAIDLGTTNTVVARWDPEAQEPRVVPLREISRPQILTETPVVPSAVYLRHPRTWRDHLGRWPFVERRWFLGRQAEIGQVAWEMNYDGRARAFARSFKPLLGRESRRPIAWLNGHPASVRYVTKVFLRELLAAIYHQHGTRIRDLVMSVPVDSYETYRAELRYIMVNQLGVRRFRTLDEPVAAAVGYGLNIEREQNLLVFDFGGGTLDVALIRTGPTVEKAGQGEVIAKQGLNLGGDHVDVWLLEEFCRRTGNDLTAWDDTDWYRALLDESRRVKEQLYWQEEATFIFQDRALRELAVDRSGARLSISREEFVQLLADCGLYVDLRRVLEEALQEAATKGLEAREIDEVLLVGGSTLLPEVHTLLEELFGRERLRDWLPFEAVAHGACGLASGYKVQDFIRHDYALLLYDEETKQAEYPIIVPEGTIYPTEPNFWEDFLTPTCPRGEPATTFELVICEISRASGTQKRLIWGPDGRLRVPGPEGEVPTAIVPLNRDNPTLGTLNPPHPPHEREARLRVGFGVNADRWLCATVYDLKRRMYLMREQPVVRLR
ncbi:MAG TPA: Hsp70 family protein [Armatimonadetes bacterium]|nr:Hsp70 family protein [Armatimonadota bacterium]